MKNTQTQHDPVLGFAERQLNAQLLRSLAGKAEFCSGCNRIADCRDWVAVDIYRTMPGKAEECVYSTNGCTKCMDKALPKIKEGIAKAKARFAGVRGILVRLEVVDSRDFQDCF